MIFPQPESALREAERMTPQAGGAPAEVSNADLAAAIAGTSANTNAVVTLDTAFTNDPPTLADIGMLRAKINELILAQRR